MGGSERLFTELAENMASKGHDVTVLTSRFDESLPANEVLNGVQIIRINARNRFSFTWKALAPGYREAKDADIIHSTTYNAALPAWLIGKLRGKSVTLTFHEVWGKLWFRLPFASRVQKSAYYWFERLVLSLPFDQYIAVSKFTEEALIEAGIPQLRISQVYNGIDYNEFLGMSYKPDPVPPTQLVYFGRLGISKGLDILLEAFSQLISEDLPVKLVLVVPKKPVPVWRKVNQIIDNLEIRNHITFHHNLERNDLYRLLQSCHFVVIPSHSEGFCYSAVESAALGLPIIHSGRGALKEVLNSEKGRLEHLSSQNLFNTIKEALQDDPELYKSQKKWNIAESVDRTESLYMLKEKGKHDRTSLLS